MNITKRGFSLVEVLLAVAIISVLSFFTLAYFRSQTYRANDARRKADLKRISVAIEEYDKDFSCYPPNLTTSTMGAYISDIPKDPVYRSAYPYETDGTACSKWFRLFSRLQNTKDPDYRVSIGPASLPKIYNYLLASPNAP